MRRKKKTKAKVLPTVQEKVLEHLDKVSPFTLCYICQRESRENHMIAANHFRCDTCKPMSYNWKEYWINKQEKKRPEAVRFLLRYCEV